MGVEHEVLVVAVTGNLHMPAPHTASVRESCSHEHKQRLVQGHAHREVLPGR